MDRNQVFKIYLLVIAYIFYTHARAYPIIVNV